MYMYTEKIFINCIVQEVPVLSIDFLKLKCQNILSINTFKLQIIF